MTSRLVFTMGFVSLGLVVFLFYRTQRKLRYLQPARSGHLMLRASKPWLEAVPLLGKDTAWGTTCLAKTGVNTPATMRQTSAKKSQAETRSLINIKSHHDFFILLRQQCQEQNSWRLAASLARCSRRQPST